MSGGKEDFLAGGGEMGALMRRKAWGDTSLGPAAAWPQSLRTAVSILLNSRYPMFIFWGPRLNKIYNDGYRPILGEKHPWALGRPGPEVWPEIWSDIGPMVERVVQKGEATWSEDLRLFMHRRGFPEEVFFTFSYSPIRDESGGVGGMFCACTETTGKVLGERRLKLLRDLAACAAEARSVDEACARSAEVLQSCPEDIPFAHIDLEDRHGWALGLHEADALRALMPIDAGPWPEPPRSVVVLPLAEHGALRPVEEGGRGGKLALGVSSRLAFDDEYRGFFDLVARQVAASIAAARATEEERRRAEALAELDRAKTAFFSNVSHEFRTPLTLMLGPVEDALADAQAALPPAQRERLELVRRSGLRLQKLVNTLLDFARIEAGRAQASYAPTDLGALTADLASSFRSAVEKAGLTLAVDCAPLSQPAYVDRDLWEKIVLNLLSNAFKFTFEGGITVSVRETQRGFTLMVRDTGTGIPAAELAHVFERFRRVEGARSRTHEGTGIGLALVKELVQLHGGEIAAESAEGQGSTFTVTLPAGKAHLPADRIGARSSLASTSLGAAPFVEEALRSLPDQGSEGLIEEVLHRKPEPGPKPRIVWADDNADMREYVRRLLAPQYDIEAVADGEAALAAVRRRPPDLVLADVMMPRLDGFGLLAALRADERLARLPVILLSARAGEEARMEGLNAGADDYIVKPFGARELLARVSGRLELAALRRRVDEERSSLPNLLAQTGVPVAVLRGPELVFESANPAYLEVVGGRAIVGKPLLQAMPELAGQGYEDLLLEAMRDGTPRFGRDARALIARGGRLEETYWTFVYAPLRGADGTNDRVIAICTEVTEAARARAALEESEARYRSIFQLAGVSIWEEDFTAVLAIIEAMKRQGVTDFRAHLAAHPRIVREAIALVKVIDVNEASLRLFGAKDKVQLLESLERIFTPGTEAVFAGEMMALAEGRPRFEGEAELRTLSGERLDVLLTVALPPPGGRADRVLVTLTDITERKRAEAALQEGEARYRAVVESQSEMVCRYRTDGTILFANGGYAKARGTTPEALVGQNFWSFIPAADHEGVRAMLASLTPQAPEVRIENRFDAAEGERWTLWTNRALAFDEDGRVVEAQSTGIDITERKRAEEALREADRRKGEFLTILSHELRNPLAPIRNAVALLRQVAEDAGIRAQAVAILERQVSHLIRLVDDLLDVTRINRGEVALQQAPVRVADLVASAVETARPALQARQHRLEVQPPPEDLAVRGDAMRLSQVMANILNNAATYTPPGGRIQVSALREGAQAVLRVRDNGSGISAETLKGLFDLFTRGENARQHPGGFGVGLALARRLVEMHGGTIDAASEGPGRGAELTVRLPLAPATPRISKEEMPSGEGPSQEVPVDYRTASRAR